MELADRFEAARPRLMSLAYRLTGSHHDAEDAVQTVWTRVQTANTEVVNPDAWFTTVTARLCIDQLRTRKRRGELPLPANDVAGTRLAADEEFLRREQVSRALLVVLDELSPRQRVAFVLHDLFTIPFDQVAAVLGTSPVSAKKLASRARIRLRGARPAEAGHGTEQFAIIEAFLAAARGGDLATLVGLLAPDAVRTADPAVLPAGAPTTVHSARVIAEETRFFVDRIAVAVPVFIDGRAGAVIAPGGHAFALIRFEFHGGLVAGIDIAPYRPGAVSPAG